MKKIFVFIILSVFLSAAFTESRNKTSASDEVIIVGKVSVKVEDENFQFYAKTWGITDFDQPDFYIFCDDDSEEKKKSSSTIPQTIRLIDPHPFSPNEYFFSKRKKENNILTTTSPILWVFFSNPSFSVYLPLSFTATIPKEARYVYIGDFEYILEGSDFHVKNIVIKDTFDEAKKQLEKKMKLPVELYRVEISPLNK